MTLRADPDFLDELRRYGAFDVTACMNCGNCTAVCPLSKDNDAFPRRLIRYAQLGLADHLLASKELWVCHYCGECSETCPRQADPGEFMAAARRYAIARLAPGPLARWFYTSTSAAWGGLLGVAALLIVLFLAGSPGFPQGEFSTANMLDFVPYEVIHWTGLAVIAFLVLVLAGTVLSMAWSISKAPVPGGLGRPDERPSPFPFRKAWEATREDLAEIFAHRSFRECRPEEAGDPDAGKRPWYVARWALHWSLMVGFFGLFTATALDYLFKDPDLHVPIWSPIRLLGTLAGLLFLYGVGGTLWARWTRRERGTAVTRFTDLSFLVLLLIIGLTGYLIELGIYLHVSAPAVTGTLYVLFLVHLVAAMELLLLLPFTKFAHAVYRPVALWLHHFRRLRRA